MDGIADFLAFSIEHLSRVCSSDRMRDNSSPFRDLQGRLLADQFLYPPVERVRKVRLASM
jgi:hypothetical protein